MTREAQTDGGLFVNEVGNRQAQADSGLFLGDSGDDSESQSVGCMLFNSAGFPITSGTTVVYVVSNNGTQSVGSGSCTHAGNGWWNYAMTAIEADYDHVAFSFVNSSAISSGFQVWRVDANRAADAVLDRDMSVGTDSGSPTVRTVRQAFRYLRNKWVLAGTALSVKKENDSTESWSSTMTTDVAAVPVVGSDPAP